MRILAVALLAFSFAITPLAAAKRPSNPPVKATKKKVKVKKPKHKAKARSRVN
ncbi:MAG TPA: hypothetical protein VG273_13260 [Bryobacteraceae bacterium]|jgi:hypothetical protein|nr:hypothetical protein [Bryobacteraceae bacterium]